MTNKTTKLQKQTHSTDYLNLLEYKIQQDHIAYKKVIKWAATIQNRIEKTQKQLEDQKAKSKEIEAKIQNEETRPNEIKILNVPDQTSYTIAQIKQIDENNSFIRNCTCTYGQTHVYTIEKKHKNFAFSTDKSNNCQETKKKENESFIKIAEERLEALLETLIDKRLSTLTKILNCQENEILGLKADVVDKMKDISKMQEELFEIDKMVNGVENSISNNHSEIKELVKLIVNTSNR